MTEPSAPTGRELEILKVLWEHGPANVRTVYRHMLANQPRGKDLAYNTVQTLLRLMEEKDLVTHELDGRAFVYSAAYSREQSAVRFLDRVFDGAASELVSSLLRSERISPDELNRVQKLIADARRKRRPEGQS
ncbi:MAG: BlaI/MecI/CopY family transcriptional regulator [Gemmataceae bacterium]